MAGDLTRSSNDSHRCRAVIRFPDQDGRAVCLPCPDKFENTSHFFLMTIEVADFFKSFVERALIGKQQPIGAAQTGDLLTAEARRFMPTRLSPVMTARGPKTEPKGITSAVTPVIPATMACLPI